MNGIREFPCFGKVRSRGLAPNYVGVRSICKSACNRGVNPPTELIETLRRTLAINEFAVARVGVGKQQSCRIGIRSRNKNRWHAADVCAEARCNQFLDEFACRHYDFSAEVSTFFC